ncbi:hypothetical protein CALVIDRAFT_526768 [Calocera viscosa TUFC12733]|uniref:Uncharacterized protein n=1 Tax=Calocera viscosa (strain TUFC12733) TaxID=1330018 RepID=A0A167NG01_CALVF|nr:hypothetical protein CALVIDRAFT_526768 [Calocera viscosa TUFC12733]
MRHCCRSYSRSALIKVLARNRRPNLHFSELLMLYRIRSKEGRVFEVEDDVIKHIGILRTCTQAALADNAPQSEAIPVPCISGRVLEKWCTHYRDHDAIENIPADATFFDWDLAFIGGEVNDMALCCKGLIEVWYGRSVEFIRCSLGEPNDFPPEARASIDRENRWTEFGSGW